MRVDPLRSWVRGRRSPLVGCALALLLCACGDAPTNATPPAGDWIAFVSDRDGNSNIYLVRPDGSGLHRITDHAARESEPAWSPDGRLLAFVSARDTTRTPSSPSEEIYVMRADGTGVRRVTNDPVGGYAPRWSPDGRRILYSAWDAEESRVHLFVIAADGTNRTRLTRGAWDDFDAAWSPDGQRVVFVSNRRGPNGDLWAKPYIMNADGSNQQPLPRVCASNVSTVRWSPDGTRLAFNCDDSFGTGGYVGSAIYVAAADGTNAVRLSATSGPQRGVTDVFKAWSPDGTRLALWSSRTGNEEVYTMPAAGGAAEQVTTNPASDWTGDWVRAK